MRFRRARPDRIVRSRVPAHPAIVSVQNFVDVQLLRRSRGGAVRQTLERSSLKASPPYVLGGRVRCGYCQRRMEGAARRWGTYYRCVARTLVPGPPVLVCHPKSVYLPEIAVLGPVNKWLGELFDPDNLDGTVSALVASQGGDPGRTAAGQRLNDAEMRLRRFQAAIAAGVDPAAVVDAINQAQVQRAAAKDELNNASAPLFLDTADVRAMVGALGDIGEALSRAEPRLLASLYEACGWKRSTTRRLALSPSPSGQHMSLVRVSEGGLEPPCPLRALAPQASASTYSATRTWVRPVAPDSAETIASRPGSIWPKLTRAPTVSRGAVHDRDKMTQ